MARKRYDGTEIKLGALKSVEPFIMTKRTESWVICNAEYDLSRALPFIEKYNTDHQLDKTNRLTLFQILLLAGARTIALYPKLNRFISGKRYYQRNRLNFSFAVKHDTSDPNSRETFTKFDIDPFDTIDTLREKIHRFVKEARAGDSAQEGQVQLLASMPFRIKSLIMNTMRRRDFKGKMSAGMIESDLVFCSAVWANLGSVGIKGRITHHMFEYGNASMFVTVGSIRKGVVIDENNEMCVRDVLDITYCIDERISSGKTFGLVLQKLQELSENPEVLLEKPEISEKKLKELNLVDLKKYRPYLRLKKKK